MYLDVQDFGESSPNPAWFIEVNLSIYSHPTHGADAIPGGSFWTSIFCAAPVEYSGIQWNWMELDKAKLTFEAWPTSSLRVSPARAHQVCLWLVSAAPSGDGFPASQGRLFTGNRLISTADNDVWKRRKPFFIGRVLRCVYRHWG